MKIHSRNKVLILTLSVLMYSCGQNEKEIELYQKKGAEIVQNTQKSLGGHLMKNMKSGGVEAAIPFCNAMAIPLTSEMEKKYAAGIKRVSLKNRNLNNAASEFESKVLNDYQAQVNSGKKPTPIIEMLPDDEIKYFAPIFVEKKCLACHGSLSNGLTQKTDSLIKSLYPEDKATGYSEGDLRGIWSITFKK